MTAAELRAEIRRLIRDEGLWSPYEIEKKCLSMGDEMWEAVAGLADLGQILRNEIRRQLHNLSKPNARERRERHEFYAEQAREVGCDPETDSPLRVMRAHIEHAMSEARAEGVAEFLADLAAPQGFPDGRWKSRGELTREDCLSLAGLHEGRGLAELTNAVVFGELADRLAAAGCATVGELMTGRAAIREVS